MPAQQPPPSNKGRLVGVVGATAAALLVSFTSSQEGVSLKPYDDTVANHVETVCFGETNVAMHPYTLNQCKQMLSDSLAGYANSVKDMTPGFDKLTDGRKVAVVDLAYNIGLANYRNSTLRKLYSTNQFPAACAQFIKWRFVQGRDCAIASSNCYGIYKRRLLEASACRSGA